VKSEINQCDKSNGVFCNPASYIWRPSVAKHCTFGGQKWSRTANTVQYYYYCYLVAVAPYGARTSIKRRFTSVSSILETVGRTSWNGAEAVSRPLPIHRKTQNNRSQTDMHASSEIRTHDLSVWAGEDISCFRPRDHYDRPYTYVAHELSTVWLLVKKVEVENVTQHTKSCGVVL
jgi:hypothetical protein